MTSEQGTPAERRGAADAAAVTGSAAQRAGQQPGPGAGQGAGQGAAPAPGGSDAFDRLPDQAAAVFGEHATAQDSYGLLTVDVPAADWIGALRTARDLLGCDYFDWLSAVDEPGTGFQVCAHLARLGADRPADSAAGPSAGPTGAGRGGVRHLLLRTTVPHERPELPTATALFAGAGWHERETHEMFGIGFTGHPHLVPLLLPDGFEGHPLRKDFVLAARVAKAWPGAKEPGESSADHAGPRRRQMLPPGVPDPNEWGPLKGQLPPAPARGRAAAAGDRPARRPAAERPAGRPARDRGEGAGAERPAATDPATGAEPAAEPGRAARPARRPARGGDDAPWNRPAPASDDAAPEPQTPPEAAKTEAPETEPATRPEAPESEAPESQTPKTEADRPQSEAPQSEADRPQSETPQSEAPESEAPQSEAPESEAPESGVAGERPAERPRGEER